MGGERKSHKNKPSSKKGWAPNKLSFKKIPWELLKIYIFFGVTVFILFFALR